MRSWVCFERIRSLETLRYRGQQTGCWFMGYYGSVNVWWRSGRLCQGGKQNILFNVTKEDKGLPPQAYWVSGDFLVQFEWIWLRFYFDFDFGRKRNANIIRNREAQKEVQNIALDNNFAIPGDPGFPLNQVCLIYPHTLILSTLLLYSSSIMYSLSGI
jgi:hypothetical protein